MRKIFLFISFLIFCSLGKLTAQSLNMNQLYNNDTGLTYNDCWGYVDAVGNEYAIVGTRTKIFFYNITNPSNVVLVDEFTNNIPSGLSMGNSLWRDFKTYGTKAYACADVGTEGLLVFDLSGLPDTVILENQTTSFFQRSHNIFVDTARGYLYTAGANTRSNGTIILDINTSSISQVASVALDGGYIHDLHVRDDIGYCNSENSGLVVIDFSDPQNLVTLGALDGYLGEGYNHSCWPSESGDYLVFCDETVGTKVKICDITDLGNIEITDQFNSNSPISTSIAHNPFVKGDFVYVAYYHDGVYVFDISDPDNVTTHGYYDTNPQDNNGVWGVYPYFPSGNIIATDMDNGFFILEVLNIPLPVELTYFSAISEKDKVKLQWTTATEKNSELFEVQKSANGTDFETFTRVDAAGNSDTKIDYLAFDKNPFKGDNYYRLKQVDLDGKFEYSTIEVVRFNASPIEIFPTLLTIDEPLRIVFYENIQDLQIQIFSIQGQLQQSVKLSGEDGHQEELWLNDLSNGTYVVQAFDGFNSLSQRIVVVR